MTRRLDKAVERWLAEEATGDFASERAERALEEVFRSASRPVPPPGFALAVLERAGIAPRPAGAFSSRWAHWAIAMALALAGCFLTMVPAAARLAGRAFAVGDLVEWASRGLVASTQVLAGALDVWGFLSRLGAALGTVIAVPQVALTLVLIALCAGGALRALDRLITAERSL